MVPRLWWVFVLLFPPSFLFEFIAHSAHAFKSSGPKVRLAWCWFRLYPHAVYISHWNCLWSGFCAYSIWSPLMLTKGRRRGSRSLQRSPLCEEVPWEEGEWSSKWPGGVGSWREALCLSLALGLIDGCAFGTVLIIWNALSLFSSQLGSPFSSASTFPGLWPPLSRLRVVPGARWPRGACFPTRAIAWARGSLPTLLIEAQNTQSWNELMLNNGRS